MWPYVLKANSCPLSLDHMNGLERSIWGWDCWKPPLCHSCVLCFAEHLLCLKPPCRAHRGKIPLFCYTHPPLMSGKKLLHSLCQGKIYPVECKIYGVFSLPAFLKLNSRSDFSKNAESNQSGIPKYGTFLINQAIINLIESLWSFPPTTCTPYAKRSVMWNASAGSKVSFLINNNSAWADV